MIKGVKTELVKELYVNGKESSLTIAKKLGVSRHTVLYHLRKANCTRSQSEAGILASEQQRLRNQMANQNPFWKGGRYDHKDGYVCIRKPDHPRQSAGGYVFEHVLVWEEAHGKLIPKGYVIHHLNGVKNDNRADNLVAISRKDHNTWSLTQELQRRIRELENKLAIGGRIEQGRSD